MSFNPNIRVFDAETYDSRLNRMLSYFDHLPTFIEKGKYMNKDPRNNVQAVRGRPEGSYIIKEWFFGHNIVTVDGRTYYAKRAVGASPAANEHFGQSTSNFQLSNPTTVNPVNASDTWDQFDSAVAGNGAAGTGAAISQSIKDFTSGYPLTGTDPDADNTGDAAAGVVSYGVNYTTTDFNDTQGGGSTIKNGCIHDNNSPSATTKLLTHWQFASGFAKTSNDTLKVFVNHTVGSS